MYVAILTQEEGAMPKGRTMTINVHLPATPYSGKRKKRKTAKRKKRK